MHDRPGACATTFATKLSLAIFLLLPFAAFSTGGQAAPTRAAGVAVGAQYDSTHVYVAPGDLDALVNSVVATFGGQPSKQTVTNVLPVPSSTEFRYVWTPAGTLSVFAFQTPIPFPFGQERTGYLVSDMGQAIKAARAAGADVIVEPFQDAIGIDAVIQWPGGVKMQLYWHFTPPSYAPLDMVPDNRVYVSRDEADHFVNGFVRFSQGTVVSDDPQADAGEIGRAGETYRRIRIVSLFGNVQVMVTDGHLPYPFGHEVTGYQVRDLTATLEKAKTAGVKVLSAPYTMKDRVSTVVQFPGGYIAEVHSLRAP
ncbi:MAG: glyoxalase [Candidatus Acidiferrales bacterium]|jgi:predicted enzyme related to lactoylglutathione lyase